MSSFVVIQTLSPRGEAGEGEAGEGEAGEWGGGVRQVNVLSSNLKAFL